MRSLSLYLRSSVGKKQIMAVTGLSAVRLFSSLHLAGKPSPHGLAKGL